MKSNRLEELTQNYEALINRKNEICSNSNGIYKRYYYPVLTAEHAPLIWKYDFDGSRIHYSIDANSFFHEWILFFINIIFPDEWCMFCC